MLDFSKPDTPRTPEQERRKQRRSAWLIAGILWGGIFLTARQELANTLLINASLMGVHWPVLVLSWITGIPALYLLLIAIHEGGHVVGALLARFRVLLFAASWLHITRQAEGWKVQVKKPQSKIGGMVQAHPVHTHRLRSRFALFIIGGPLANILTGVLALYGYHAVTMAHVGPYATSATAYFSSNALLWFGWMSVVVGALNLIPRTLPSGHIVDGKQLWDLARGGPAMHQQLGFLYFQSLTFAGVRPRDWDATQVENFLAHRSNTVLDFYVHLYAYSYYHDCNDLEQLRLHLNEALDRRKSASVGMQQYLLAEAAYVAALRTHNPEQARYWLDQAQLVKSFTQEEGLFAQAAVAYVEGRLAEAERFLLAARQQLREAISTGGTRQALEQMDALQNHITQAQQQLKLA